jgi:hypothetical protein
MAEAPLANPVVPLSHGQGIGTVGQGPPGWDNAGTSTGTADLKALARLVLARDIRRDSNRGALSHDPPTASASAERQGQEGAKADPALQTCGDGEAKRAAIIEHDGDIPRAWTAGFARLDRDQPPGDVPPRRWHRFVGDAGRFLDGPFCAVAVALGWGPHDLFGCDGERPFARIDQAGLLWLLHGDRLIAMTENTATIETPTGARQTYRRKAGELGRVLAWELQK